MRILIPFIFGVITFTGTALLFEWFSRRQKINGNTSDGYHTFNELYEHRNLLFINLCLTMPDKACWGPGYAGWPVLFLELSSGQISYHIQERFLPLLDDKIRYDPDYEWDKHRSATVIGRLFAHAERKS